MEAPKRPALLDVDYAQVEARVLAQMTPEARAQVLAHIDYAKRRDLDAYLGSAQELPLKRGSRVKTDDASLWGMNRQERRAYLAKQRKADK